MHLSELLFYDEAAQDYFSIGLKINFLKNICLMKSSISIFYKTQNSFDLEINQKAIVLRKSKNQFIEKSSTGSILHAFINYKQAY